MATFVLPFSTDIEADTGRDPADGDIYPRLPETFRDVVDNNPHLLEYLNMLPVSQIGIPDYYRKTWAISRNPI